MPYFYTYRITCTHPDSVEKYYYGHRKSECHPRDDVYWSSSKFVKTAILKYGSEFFKKKIIRIFASKNEAINHEIKLHERLDVQSHPIFFNRYNQSRCGFNGSYLKGKTYEEIHGIERASELKNKRSKQWKGRNNKGTRNSMYGRTHTEESKKIQSENRKGKGLGYKWVTNGIETKKIYPNESIPLGWHSGRVNVHKKKVA